MEKYRHSPFNVDKKELNVHFMYAKIECNCEGFSM